MKTYWLKLKAYIRLRLKNKWIKIGLIACLSIVLFFIGLYLSVYFGAFGKIPTKDDLSFIKHEEASQLLDRKGKLIGKYYVYDRQPVAYSDFPQHLIEALVATEDVRFYEHTGVDKKSLIRVLFKTIVMGNKSAGGGSTITLQLSKNLYGRKNYAMFGMLINKFKESIIAQRLEKIYPKEEILTLYFNTIPFSDNTYGIESASQKFFNKSVTDLSILESATLVGTLKANNYYNPRLHEERSKNRRNVVLQQMVKYGYLEQDSLAVMASKGLDLNYQSFHHDLGLAPYFREDVKKQLIKILDTLRSKDGTRFNLYKDGLKIYTTIDYHMQELAEESMRSHLSKLQVKFEESYGKNAPWLVDKALVNTEIKKISPYKSYKNKHLTEKQILDSLSLKRKVDLFNWEGASIKNISAVDSLKHFLKFLNTGMLSIDPKNGAVRTYIGGIDYRYFKYDHVSQSKRQVGSTFKPFIYTTAIENGLKPCSYYSLSKVTYTNYNDWTPSNSGTDDNDPFINYTLENALSNSINTIAVKVFEDVGMQKVVDQVKKLNIKDPLPMEPSLALGVAEISLKDLAGAYASYVNDSKPVEPYYITKIEDKEGNVIFEFKPEKTQNKAFSNYTRQVLLEMMKSTVNKGTASRLRSTYKLTNDIAGKTGTTQDNKDGWFVGITPNLVTVTWVGNDNYNLGFKTTGLGQGANSALPIFAKFYQSLNANSDYNGITKSSFERTPQQVLSDLDCEPEKRDGFLKRLFKRKNKKKKFQ